MKEPKKMLQWRLVTTSEKSDSASISNHGKTTRALLFLSRQQQTESPISRTHSHDGLAPFLLLHEEYHFARTLSWGVKSDEKSSKTMVQLFKEKSVIETNHMVGNGG
mmetsp:Transcript_34932/g.65177  ORF Transcript_34932/g.65177 Transcript_34932/m.65177 type:complete len:107 (+) Transcript_34932:29-349(+)